MMITSLSIQSASIHAAVSELQREFKWNVDRQTDFQLYTYRCKSKANACMEKCIYSTISEIILVSSTG